MEGVAGRLPVHILVSAFSPGLNPISYRKKGTFMSFLKTGSKPIKKRTQRKIYKPTLTMDKYKVSRA